MMSKRSKTSQLFTVRAPGGGLIGTYRAFTAQQAVQRAKDEYATTAAVFRRSQPMPSTIGWVASVEPPAVWE